MFDSTIGRWQSKDPKSFDAGDTNLYRYVGNHPSYATDPSGLEEWDPAVIGAAIRSIDPDLAELLEYHAYLSPIQGDRPIVRHAGNSKRYINAQYPASWSNQQVIDSIFSNTWTIYDSDLLDHVRTAARDYGRLTNPMGDDPDRMSGRSEADVLRENQRERYREAVSKIAPMIVDTMRSFPFGEGAYAAYMLIDGQFYEYGKGIVKDAAETASVFAELVKSHPAEAITTGVVVVVVGGRYVVKKIDDVAPREAGAFRAPRPEDTQAIAKGQRIMPKSTTGDILDHIQGRDSKYISLSLTKGGTARFHGPDGIAEIDLEMALKTGSGLVSHKQVLQVARKHGTTKDVKNVLSAQEVLLTNGLDPRAIIRVTGQGG